VEKENPVSLSSASPSPSLFFALSSHFLVSFDHIVLQAVSLFKLNQKARLVAAMFRLGAVDQAWTLLQWSPHILNFSETVKALCAFVHHLIEPIYAP
jgi:hypothetical protein